MDTITLPQGKIVRMGDERYRTLKPVDVPADQLEPAKKQATRMRPFGCPVCGQIGRTTAKHKAWVETLVCSGNPAMGSHDPDFLKWMDPEPVEDTPEGEGD